MVGMAVLPFLLLGQRSLRTDADVRAFALPSDKAQVLDGAGAGGAEPVRGAGVELRGFPGFEEEEVVLAEDQS